MKQEFQARQGDLYFVPVEEKPKGLTRTQNPVLAYGEVTGHAHKITTDLSHVDVFVDPQGNMFVQSKTGEPVVIEHDEHGTVTLPGEGLFEVIRQREYDPIEAARERRVAD